MLYSYDRLNRMIDWTTRQAKSGSITEKEKQVGIAAAYAIDLCDIALDSKMCLDFSFDTEENLPTCLGKMHFENVKRNMTVEESRQDLIKKFGSYELFALLNSVNCEKEVADIVLQASILIVKPKLVIETKQSVNGKKLTFDVYKVAEDTLRRWRLSDGKGNEALFFGTLQPFYQTFSHDFLKILF